MLICFHEDVFGAGLHLVHDTDEGTYQWTPDKPEEAWVVGDGPRELLTALSLAGVDVGTSPPPKWIKPLVTTCGRTTGPWQMCMPGEVWASWVENTVDAVSTHAQMTNLSYYEDVYQRSMEVLRSLQPATIDIERLNQYVNDKKLPHGVRMLVESFRPGEGGCADPVEYSLVGTVSGRMVVTSGPQILLLRKDLRDVLTSSYEGGQIVQVDYVSLEPRLALAVVGREIPEDVYEDIRTKVFDGQFDRNTMKPFVLAALYGSGADTVHAQTDIEIEVCREYIPKVRDYFGRRKLMGSLVRECKKRRGKIKNHYGRILRAPDPKPYKLYNLFMQSTAVDVAMLGFRNIVRHIGARKIKPLFVIHDSIILDCGEPIDDLIKHGERVPGFEVHLPLEVSTL